MALVRVGAITTGMREGQREGQAYELLRMENAEGRLRNCSAQQHLMRVTESRQELPLSVVSTGEGI